jgi:hypothetical protein
MRVVIPTFESFIYWYRRYQSKQCTYEYARQMVGFHKTQWHRLTRDYKAGLDISKYFKEVNNYG